MLLHFIFCGGALTNGLVVNGDCWYIYLPSSVTDTRDGKMIIMNKFHGSNIIISWLEIFLCEFFGTCFLMFFGCLGSFTAVGTVKALASMQSGIVFGFTVSSIIFAMGHLSKAHLNPAVTLCAFLLGHISLFMASIYLIAEIMGAILGMLLLKFSVPEKLYHRRNAEAGPCGFCSTSIHSELSLLQAFFFEFLATSLLILVVCSDWDSRNAKINDSTPIKFGLLVTMLSVALGPFTGASMNPVRSLAPAIMSNVWQDQWLYWLAPLSATVVTTFYYKYVMLRREKEKEKAYV